MSAREAAGELGVSLPTLYAYVSRGLVRSEEVGGKRRNKRYRAEDVRRLKERAEGRRDPGRVAEGALDWGMPVMESAITFVSDGGLYYRGQDAVDLARGSSVEEVAALVWTGAAAEGIFSRAAAGFPEGFDAVRGRAAELGPVETFQALLPLAAAGDLAAYDLRPAAVARTGARILRLLAAVAAGGGMAEEGGIAEILRRGWVAEKPGAGPLLSLALVLCADHELNVSTFAARCVASAAATPYDAVSAGLAAMRGTRHGGQVDLVEAFLREVEAGGDAYGTIAARLRRGERLPGFGHPLYPRESGDPRGAELLRAAAAARPGSDAVALSRAVTGAALDLVGEKPTVDLGLVILARTLGLPPGSALALFAIGRTIGWIGHAIEQYGSDALIRPRARYVGEQPG